MWFLLFSWEMSSVKDKSRDNDDEFLEFGIFCYFTYNIE